MILSVTCCLFYTIKIKALPQAEADLVKPMCVSHFSKRSYYFCSFVSWYQTKYETFVLPLLKILVYRRCGHWKCLYISNKCLLTITKPSKRGPWVYTWIHFRTAAALPRQGWVMLVKCWDGDIELMSRHSAAIENHDRVGSWKTPNLLRLFSDH